MDWVIHYVILICQLCVISTSIHEFFIFCQRYNMFSPSFRKNALAKKKKNVKPFYDFLFAHLFRSGAPRKEVTPLPPSVTSTARKEDLAPPSEGASQADSTSHLTIAPSAALEPLTPLTTLKPVTSEESKALGSHSTATAMVMSTTPAGDSSVSQHCN